MAAKKGLERSQASRAAFHLQVYDIVGAIPPGRVMTYGEIAALIPPPGGMPWSNYRRVRARWVGYAMRACPEDLPWHRVVNAQGRISPRMGHGPDIQRIFLEEEGVLFDDGQRIDLARFGWNPSHLWLLARGFLPPPMEVDNP